MSDLARVRAALAGKYIIERELGHGGMAAVYLARDLKHGRHVALKIPGAIFGGSAGTERFLREIRTTARLTHPGILPLHDSGEAVGVPFYTMPWVDGESLRALIQREGALPLDRALAIVSSVADALGAAHSAGVIHRDVKPENILISKSGHVWVSDFGLAHAIAEAASQRLSTGAALGSLHYMSPEQALGHDRVGPPTDVYALGCVLFELLTGAPPFDGPSATILPRHITEPAPKVSEKRADIPERVGAALDKSLAKDPAQRFQNAADFRAALLGTATQGPAPVFHPHVRKLAGRKWAVGAILTSVAAALLFMTSDSARHAVTGLLSAPVDSARYAILPFTTAASISSYDVEHLIYNALSRWDGITVVDPLQVADQVTRRGDAVSRSSQISLAKEFEAGRFISGDITRVGDTLQVHARLYDTSRKGRQLRSAYARFPLSLANADSIFAMLADSLLFQGSPLDAFGQRARGTRSMPGLRAYLDAHKALRDWEVARADTLFLRATELDPAYAQAYLWRAQVRNWMGRDDAAWKALADKAAAGRGRLNPKEQVLADALQAQSSGDYVRACGLYRQLRAADSTDFTASYGLAECLRRDGHVIPDRASPTGWSFRSSAREALENYRQAFQVIPASHKAFRAGAFRHVRGVFLVGASSLRPGFNDSLEYFLAAPAWLNDSLTFYPQKVSVLGDAGTPVLLPENHEALQRLRGIFRDVARTWVDAYPQSPSALEADAIARELQGDYVGALAGLRAARSAVKDDHDHSTRLVAAEVWLRTKLAIPHDTAELKAVRLLADSLVKSSKGTAPGTLNQLSSLAMLTGRTRLAARLARASAGPQGGAVAVSPAVTGPARALLVFAALNGPIDSIIASERLVDAAIRNSVNPARWIDAHNMWTARPATIAFPAYRSPHLTQDVAANDYLVKAQRAFSANDTATMLAILDSMATTRKATVASALKPDGLYPEAWLIGQTRGAIAAGEWLCPMLQAMPFFEPGSLDDQAFAGTLNLSVLLYSQALRQTGSVAEADKWRKAVEILWAGADAEQKRLIELSSRPMDGRANALTRAPPSTNAGRQTGSPCFPGGR